ncbi:IclR family transcriptional regulator [Yinghuangia seranimata]|uniref:IclR family transcriptional regulator n=1 Tax=Yinghuangia seranimata TaxID=408067 RepID=UPI00248CC1B8|nr:IclR family transcriptional regulator [Yinghuangia seranimata]MDI2126015.1 IclR family transcriptional regulator [Yinghuangia seranimata]
MSSVKEIQSVKNACLLLEELARQQPAGVSDLARSTGIDKSAVHRLAVTLHSAGWLRRTGDGRWYLAPGLVSVLREPASASLRESARPFLEAARDATGETAMLVVPDGDRLMIADAAESRHTLRVAVPVGSAMPAKSSSALRAIASRLPEERLEPWRRVDPELTDEVLRITRYRGWGLNDNEVADGTRAVGAALRAEDGTPVAALVVVGPSTRFGSDLIPRHGALVARLADDWGER